MTVKAKKHLGQHFLQDESVAEQIADNKKHQKQQAKQTSTNKQKQQQFNNKQKLKKKQKDTNTIKLI